MAKAPQQPTATELEGSVAFVLYELWMLRESARVVEKTRHKRTAEEVVLLNLGLGGLVTHARNLRDFFFTKVDPKTGSRATKPDDIAAVDYFSDPSRWPWTSAALPPYLAQHKPRMDKALAHLTTARLGYKGAAKGWDHHKLPAEIGNAWFEFIKQLELYSEPAHVWFRSHDRAKDVPFSPPF